MDRKKIQQQAQNLRNKQLSRKQNSNPPTISSGVVKFNKPIPKPATEVNVNPPTSSQIRMLRAKRLLEQRKTLLSRRIIKQDSPSQGVSEMAADKNKPKPTQTSQTPPPPKKRKGCSGCRRGK